MVRVALVVSLLIVPAVAQASILVINPADFPFGTDLSVMFEGVTLSRVTNRPNTDGFNGHENFQPIASSATSSATRFNEIEEYNACRIAGERGTLVSCSSHFSVLEIVFDRPTDFVQFDSLYLSDRPGVLAYDVDGNQLNPFGYFDGLTTGTFSESPYNNWAVNVVQRNQPDIARIVYGGVTGVTTLTRIEAHHVPAPSTLLLVALGALVFAGSRSTRLVRSEDTSVQPSLRRPFSPR